MKYIIERLKEPSTYRGLAVMLAVAGVKISPEQTDAITAAVVAILAAIEVFRTEKDKAS